MMPRLAPLLALTLALGACGSFDPDEPYRCATDGDCIAGYACLQAVCARLQAPQAHRVLYRRSGANAHLFALSPDEATPVSVTEALIELDLEPETESGALSPSGAWLAFATTRGNAECDGYACLAIASGDLQEAALVILEATSGPVHPSTGPMDIDDDARRIAFLVDFQVQIVERLAGEPLDGGRFSDPVPFDTGAPASSGLAYAPVLLPSGDQDRVAWACGPEPYLNEGRGICQRRIGPGPAPIGDVERIGPEILPSSDGSAWLSSPRYAWVSGAPRIAFVAHVANATNIWHAALDGTDAVQVTTALAGDAGFEHLCVFGGDRAVTMATSPESYTLQWLPLGGGPFQVLETIPVGDPLPGLLGCH